MDDWEKFNETSLLEKEDFYSHLCLEDITDADYMHPRRVCKDFKIENIGHYYHFYVQIDTLLPADQSENFQNMGLEMYEIDPYRFLTTPGLTRQTF